MANVEQMCIHKFSSCERCGYEERIYELEHALADATKERDELRESLRRCEQCGELGSDECLTVCSVCKDTHEKAIRKTIDQRDKARGDLDSLCRELATICGGPGTPRAGEARVTEVTSNES